MLVALLLIQAETAAASPPIRIGQPFVEQPCRYDGSSTDITVCGRRSADRFRVPFIVHEAGDRRYEGVPAERERLLHRTNPTSDLTPFLVGGGMTGVKMSTRGGVTGATDRPLAP